MYIDRVTEQCEEEEEGGNWTGWHCWQKIESTYDDMLLNLGARDRGLQKIKHLNSFVLSMLRSSPQTHSSFSFSLYYFIYSCSILGLLCLLGKFLGQIPHTSIKGKIMKSGLIITHNYILTTATAFSFPVQLLSERRSVH